ncbi:hypothetical protein BKA69DRAFT_1060824 [Paraphysoderma sedebokerense]|nr:hypothetical protein BKA69DRAFT_1060824 [Paraphysoderma sedebokerense]
MLTFDDLRFACLTCIKGHRSTTCSHSDRTLYEVRKKGRPRSGKVISNNDEDKVQVKLSEQIIYLNPETDVEQFKQKYADGTRITYIVKEDKPKKSKSQEKKTEETSVKPNAKKKSCCSLLESSNSSPKDIISVQNLLNPCNCGKNGKAGSCCKSEEDEHTSSTFCASSECQCLHSPAAMTAIQSLLESIPATSQMPMPSQNSMPPPLGPSPLLDMATLASAISVPPVPLPSTSLNYIPPSITTPIVIDQSSNYHNRPVLNSLNFMSTPLLDGLPNQSQLSISNIPNIIQESNVSTLSSNVTEFSLPPLPTLLPDIAATGHTANFSAKDSIPPPLSLECPSTSSSAPKKSSCGSASGSGSCCGGLCTCCGSCCDAPKAKSVSSSSSPQSSSLSSRKRAISSTDPLVSPDENDQRRSIEVKHKARVTDTQNPVCGCGCAKPLTDCKDCYVDLCEELLRQTLVA